MWKITYDRGGLGLEMTRHVSIQRASKDLHAPRRRVDGLRLDYAQIDDHMLTMRGQTHVKPSQVRVQILSP